MYRFKMKPTRTDWIFFGICAFLALVSLGLAIAFPFIYSEIKRDNLVLSPKSKSYQMWIETPLPMYLDIYVFNVTNSHEVEKNHSAKIIVKEVGPFIFREVHDRVNVSWNLDGTVSYNQTRRWTFVPEGSVPLNTTITNFDAIALGAAHLARLQPKNLQTILSDFLWLTSKLFVSRPAEEWLFKGMQLPLLKIVSEVESKLPFLKRFLDMPDRFGFFYQRNMSAAYDGRFNVFTGSNALTEVGNMVSWNNMSQTNFFENYCGMVNGSAGEIFPPNNGNEFTLFITDVCSSLKLKFNSVVNVEGLFGRQYVGDETLFDNGANVPENSCFCDGECVPTGARNLSNCRQGAPVFVSYPHFYLADPSYHQNVSGLTPNRSLHEFRLTLEPATGIPLDVRAQLQVNIRVEPNPHFSFYKNLRPAFVPMLWFNQRAHISSPLVSQAHLLILLGSLHIVLYSITALFIVCIAARFLYNVLKDKSSTSNSSEDKDLLIDNDTVQS